MKSITNCSHVTRKHRGLGLCNACYLKQNGGSKKWYARNRQKAIERTSELRAYLESKFLEGMSWDN